MWCYTADRSQILRSAHTYCIRLSCGQKLAGMAFRLLAFAKIRFSALDPANFCRPIKFFSKTLRWFLFVSKIHLVWVENRRRNNNKKTKHGTKHRSKISKFCCRIFALFFDGWFAFCENIWFAFLLVLKIIYTEIKQCGKYFENSCTLSVYWWATHTEYKSASGQQALKEKW